MQRILDISVSAVLAVAAVAAGLEAFSVQFAVPTFGGDVGPAFAPRGFLAVWFVLAVVSFINATKAPAEKTERAVNFRQLIPAVVVTVVTGFAMTRIGFFLAAVPGFFLFCLAFGYRNYLLLIVASIAAPLLIWALFTFGFELLLPRSPWFNRI